MQYSAPVRKGDILIYLGDITKMYKTKKDIVIELLREAIVTGKYVPGERILQDELIERFNFSATPIREALQQLEAEGVLEHCPHKGVRVADVHLEEVKEIYQIRVVLEALATRLAVPYLSNSDFEQLQKLEKEIETHIEKGALYELSLINYRFHMLIFEATNMSELCRIIQSLWTKFPMDTLHILPGRAKKAAKEHRLIIDSLKSGDADLASKRAQEHIEHAFVSLSEYLTQSKK